LVKAFFLDLDLYFGEEQTHKKIRLGTHQGHHKKRLKSEDEAERRDQKEIPHACFKSLYKKIKKGQERRPKPEVSSIPKHKFGMIGNQMLALLTEKRVGAKKIIT